MCRLFGQFMTYPLDVVRRRMQVASLRGPLVDGVLPPHKPMRYICICICVIVIVISVILIFIVCANYLQRAVFRELLAKEGYRGLYKGFTLNIVKGPVTLSISLTTYDLLKKHIGIE